MLHIGLWLCDWLIVDIAPGNMNDWFKVIAFWHRRYRNMREKCERWEHINPIHFLSHHKLTRAANLTQSARIIPIFIYHTVTYKTATLISLILKMFNLSSTFKTCAVFSEFSCKSSLLQATLFLCFSTDQNSCCCLPQRSLHLWCCLISQGTIHDPCDYIHTPVYTETHMCTHRYMNSTHQCSDQYWRKLSTSRLCCPGIT